MHEQRNRQLASYALSVSSARVRNDRPYRCVENRSLDLIDEQAERSQSFVHGSDGCVFLRFTLTSSTFP